MQAPVVAACCMHLAIEVKVSTLPGHDEAHPLEEGRLMAVARERIQAGKIELGASSISALHQQAPRPIPVRPDSPEVNLWDEVLALAARITHPQKGSVNRREIACKQGKQSPIEIAVEIQRLWMSEPLS